MFELRSLISDGLKDSPELRDFRFDRGRAFQAFWGRAKLACKLVLQEKEIVAFAILQWLVIGIAYLVWTQILGMFPDEVWKAASEDDGSLLLPNLILIAWSAIIVGIAAFPLGILNACIGAVHALRRSGQRSTIAECFALAAPRAWSLWIFHWIDGWITVNQIFDRLPRKDDRRTLAQRAATEALYYAWKVGSAGVLPAMVNGKNVLQAGRSSIGFVLHKFKDVAVLRAGYSMLCWIVGIGAYFGGIFVLSLFPSLWPDSVETGRGIMQVYVIAALPLMFALGIVVVVLRPIYVIGMSDIYADYLEETGQVVAIESRHGRVQANSAFVAGCVAAGVLAVALLFAVVNRGELGLSEAMSHIDRAGNIESKSHSAGEVGAGSARD